MLLIHHCFDAVITVLFIEVFIQKGGCRESLPAPALVALLMFTAPRLSIASRALSFPADGELTVFIGLRTLQDWRLHTRAPQPASSFSFLHLLTALEPTGWLWLEFQRQELALLFDRGPLRGRCVGDLDPLKLRKLQLTTLPFAALADQGTKLKWQGGPF